MTPQELCSLASKINAAVPGLVPEFCPSSVGDVYESATGTIHSKTTAQAIIVGLVSAAMARLLLEPNVFTTLNDLVVVVENDLGKSIATRLYAQLPEAP